VEFISVLSTDPATWVMGNGSHQGNPLPGVVVAGDPPPVHG
jgi:hypothetical protein